eukprot:s1989_g16.t1
MYQFSGQLAEWFFPLESEGPEPDQGAEAQLQLQGGQMQLNVRQEERLIHGEDPYTDEDLASDEEEESSEEEREVPPERDAPPERSAPPERAEPPERTEPKTGS